MINKIEKNWNNVPTIVDQTINDNCLFENTIVGFGILIIDTDFINDMHMIAEKLKDNKNLLGLITAIYNEINNYFYSDNDSDKSREETYLSNCVTNEEGMIIGTKLSSLKGKNIAKCSEKSIAAYIILRKMYEMNYITRKPSLVLSYLSTDEFKNGSHAFVMLDKEICNDFTKHLLFDVENPSLIEHDGKQEIAVGLYSLTDDEYHNLINGYECSPKSLYEFISQSYHEISGTRTYGNVDYVKTKQNNFI